MARRYSSSSFGIVKLVLAVIAGAFFSVQIKGLLVKVPFIGKFFNSTTPPTA